MTSTETPGPERSRAPRLLRTVSPATVIAVLLAVVTTMLFAVALLTAGAPHRQDRLAPTPAPGPSGALPATHPVRTAAILIR
jgi:hypothetical protein